MEEKFFFNGQIKLIIASIELKMSLWVDGFAIFNTLTNEEIIPFFSSFNLNAISEQSNVLKIKFSIYPNGAKVYEIEVNPFLKTFLFENKTFSTNDFVKVFSEKE